ncbi:MAG: helix-turn-helix domain-containing protein [Olsenella sp.]|nr:helix-turn-helix domain-containing protein [Olsenella sp.]
MNEYVISKRMGEAQRLLMFGDEGIKDVARACGYDNIQYFYHVFGEHARCTPAEFRRRYRG